jgi:hypothetical protein
MSDNQPGPPAQIEASQVATELDSEETGIVATYDGLSWRVKLAVLGLVVLGVAVVLAVWRNYYFHWFEVHSGTVNEAGPYYAFWSGFGSDLGEATIFVGIIATWRHHSCHVRGCARIGRQVPGTPYLACPKHHPEHQGNKRSVSLEDIHDAHKRATNGK